MGENVCVCVEVMLQHGEKAGAHLADKKLPRAEMGIVFKRTFGLLRKID